MSVGYKSLSTAHLYVGRTDGLTSGEMVHSLTHSSPLFRRSCVGFPRSNEKGRKKGGRKEGKKERRKEGKKERRRKGGGKNHLCK